MLEEMISNFNNITLRDIVSYNFTVSCFLIGITVILIIIVTFGMVFSEDDMLYSIKNKFIRFIIIFPIVTIVCSICLSFILMVAFEGEVRYKRLDEIVSYANEKGLSDDLDITKDLIIYKDTACRHNISNIESYCFKSDNGWVIVED